MSEPTEPNTSLEPPSPQPVSPPPTSVPSIDTQSNDNADVSSTTTASVTTIVEAASPVTAEKDILSAASIISENAVADAVKDVAKDDVIGDVTGDEGQQSQVAPREEVSLADEKPSDASTQNVASSEISETATKEGVPITLECKIVEETVDGATEGTISKTTDATDVTADECKTVEKVVNVSDSTNTTLPIIPTTMATEDNVALECKVAEDVVDVADTTTTTTTTTPATTATTPATTTNSAAENIAETIDNLDLTMTSSSSPPSTTTLTAASPTTTAVVNEDDVTLPKQGEPGVLEATITTTNPPSQSSSSSSSPSSSSLPSSITTTTIPDISTTTTPILTATTTTPTTTPTTTTAATTTPTTQTPIKSPPSPPEASRRGSVEKKSNFLRQFRSNSSSSGFKKFTASQFMEVWNHYDTDGNGYIEDHELDGFLREFVLSSVGENDNRPEILSETAMAHFKETFMDAFDENQDGMIDISELAEILPTDENFLLLFHLKNPLQSSVEFMKIWRIYDKNCKGYIESKELKSFLKHILDNQKTTVTEDKLNEYTETILNLFDSNRDGKLQLAEMARLMPVKHNFLSKPILKGAGCITRSDIDKLFRIYDQNRNGTIEDEELIGFLKDLMDLGQKDYTLDDINNMRKIIMDHWDLDHDGTISKTELRMFLIQQCKISAESQGLTYNDEGDSDDDYD